MSYLRNHQSRDNRVSHFLLVGLKNQSVVASQKSVFTTSTQSHPIIVPITPVLITERVVNAEYDCDLKPGISYKHLIFLAIESSESKCMKVQDIYAWCMKNFACFRTSKKHWTNSIRHTLSINKRYFRKLDRDMQSRGRGCLWTIDPRERQNLYASLRHPPSIALQPITTISTPLATSSGSLVITSAPVSEDRSPPKLSVDVIPDDRSTKDPEPTAFPESESLGATEICGPATISLPVGFETWSAEEEEKFEESKRRLLGPMGYDDLS
nr:hypothetical transcript [Hymenolepis microstoma]